MNTEVLFSSKNEVWATPQDFFDKLNSEEAKRQHLSPQWL